MVLSDPMGKTRKSSFQHYVEYFAWLAVAGVLKFVPRPVQILLADAAGWLFYVVLRVRRSSVDEHLEIAFGKTKTSQERKRIGRRSWQNSVLTFLEFLQPNPMGSRGWDDFPEHEGYEEYAVPLKKKGGNGFIITGHMGNWEVMGKLGERDNVEFAAVAKAMHNPLVNEMILESRKARGLQILQLQSNMKGIVDAIRAGKWVVFVGDQDARHRGIFVDFFGKPASTAEGPAHFAYKMGLPLLPIFCVRLHKKGRPLKVIIMKPIYPDQSADRDGEVRRITQLHTNALEEVVTRFPADYFWLHRRWKTQPKQRKQASGAQRSTD
jgi:Kdo2-lipid IVA lauroyltransferase/acyltransferase